MSKPRAADATESFGSDSFLDVVANMVGILIILVIIVGLRVKQAPPPVVAEDPALAKARGDAVALETDVRQLETQIKAMERETKAKRHERAELAFVAAAAKRVLEEQRQTLDARQRVELEIHGQMAAAEQ